MRFATSAPLSEIAFLITERLKPSESGAFITIYGETTVKMGF